MITHLNTRNPRGKLYQILCACCLYPWRDSPLLGLRCVMYSRLCGWCNVFSFHTMAQCHFTCTSKWRWNMTSITAETLIKFCSAIKTRIWGAKSAIYDFSVDLGAASVTIVIVVFRGGCNVASSDVRQHKAVSTSAGPQDAFVWSSAPAERRVVVTTSLLPVVTSLFHLLSEECLCRFYFF